MAVNLSPTIKGKLCIYFDPHVQQWFAFPKSKLDAFFKGDREGYHLAMANTFCELTHCIRSIYFTEEHDAT